MVAVAEQQSRPGDESSQAATEAFGGAEDHDTGSDAGVFFRNAYAVLVRGRSVRRHVYLNLPGAQRVVERARARGDQADLVLVRLVPVDAPYLDVQDDQLLLDQDDQLLLDGGVR